MPIQSLIEVSHWSATVIFDTTGTTNDITTNLKGIITKFKAPELEREFDTAKRAGELGQVPRPKHFKELKTSFTVRSVYKEFIEALTRGLILPIELKTTACLVDDNGVVTPYSVRTKGFTSKIPFGDLSDDGMEGEVEMMVYYLEMKLGTTSTVVFDPRNYELSIGGTNLFADIKNVLEPVT